VYLWAQPDAFITIAPNPMIIPIGLGVVPITVTANVALGTPSGGRNFKLFIKGACADLDVNLKISIP
jgi:hypothetical protein